MQCGLVIIKVPCLNSQQTQRSDAAPPNNNQVRRYKKAHIILPRELLLDRLQASFNDVASTQMRQLRHLCSEVNVIHVPAQVFTVCFVLFF